MNIMLCASYITPTQNASVVFCPAGPPHWETDWPQDGKCGIKALGRTLRCVTASKSQVVPDAATRYHTNALSYYCFMYKNGCLVA